jgi:hypothetical protein
MEPKPSEFRSQWSVAATIIALCVVGWAPPAAAYRPFDGTDAAVADVGEVEIELQPAGLFRENSQTTLIAPFVVYNHGFAERWELVVQGQTETPLTTTGPTSLNNAGVFLNKPGVLQDKSGPSIATEFGPLLPGINAEQGVGFSWAGIMSNGGIGKRLTTTWRPISVVIIMASFFWTPSSKDRSNGRSVLLPKSSMTMISAWHRKFQD